MKNEETPLARFERRTKDIKRSEDDYIAPHPEGFPPGIMIDGYFTPTELRTIADAMDNWDRSDAEVNRTACSSSPSCSCSHSAKEEEYDNLIDAFGEPVGRSPKDEGKEDARLPLTAADWEGGPWWVQTRGQDGPVFKVCETYTRSGNTVWIYAENESNTRQSIGLSVQNLAIKGWLRSRDRIMWQGCWRGEGGHTSCSSSAEASRGIEK